MARAQGLSLNTIVIAALVVLVLVILAAVFMGRMSVFTGQVSDCRGECKDNCLPEETQISGECENDYEVCCINIERQQER